MVLGAFWRDPPSPLASRRRLRRHRHSERAGRRHRAAALATNALAVACVSAGTLCGSAVELLGGDQGAITGSWTLLPPVIYLAAGAMMLWSPRSYHFKRSSDAIN